MATFKREFNFDKKLFSISVIAEEDDEDRDEEKE